jgi:creatinine amidohydrolase
MLQLEPGIHLFDELTYTQVRDCDPDRTLALVPILPLEEHGPHLPVGVDVFDAVAFAKSAAQAALRIRSDLVFLLLPPYSIGSHAFPFPGTVIARQRTVRDLAVAIGKSLAKSGIRYIVYSNGHGGPGHIVALEEAATIVSRRYGVRAISPSGVIVYDHLMGRTEKAFREAMADPFDEEQGADFAQDLHAGWWETSMMLQMRPDLVNPVYRELPDAPLPYLKVRKTSAHTHATGLGYMGYPSRATADLGRASLEVFGRIGGRLFVDLVEGREVEARWPWYRLLPFRTNLRRWLAFVGLAAAAVALLIILT